jgi:hypothetical protein
MNSANNKTKLTGYHLLITSRQTGGKLSHHNDKKYINLKNSPTSQYIIQSPRRIWKTAKLEAHLSERETTNLFD